MGFTVVKDICRVQKVMWSLVAGIIDEALMESEEK